MKRDPFLVFDCKLLVSNVPHSDRITTSDVDDEVIASLTVALSPLMHKPEVVVRPSGPLSTWTRPSASGAAPSARCAHSTTSAGGKMVIFGGWNGGRMLNDLHLFSPDTMTWSRPITTGEPPGPRAGHTITAVGNRVFVFGGGDGSHYLNDLHVLDLGCTWHTVGLAHAPLQRRHRGRRHMWRARALLLARGTAQRSLERGYLSLVVAMTRACITTSTCLTLVRAHR